MRRRVEPGLPVRIDDRFSLLIRARLCARERRRHLVDPTRKSIRLFPSGIESRCVPFFFLAKQSTNLSSSPIADWRYPSTSETRIACTNEATSSSRLGRGIRYWPAQRPTASPSLFLVPDSTARTAPVIVKSVSKFQVVVVLLDVFHFNYPLPK